MARREIPARLLTGETGAVSRRAVLLGGVAAAGGLAFGVASSHMGKTEVGNTGPHLEERTTVADALVGRINHDLLTGNNGATVPGVFVGTLVVEKDGSPDVTYRNPILLEQPASHRVGDSFDDVFVGVPVLTGTGQPSIARLYVSSEIEQGTYMHMTADDPKAPAYQSSRVYVSGVGDSTQLFATPLSGDVPGVVISTTTDT